MQREKLNKQNKTGKEKKEGYVVVPNYFLREWVKVLGIGPALLYLQLLSYCHKEKDIAWPTLTTLSNKLGISKNSLLSYRKILLKYGLIKKIVKRRTAQGNYQSNFYRITLIEGAKNELRQVQNLGEGSANIAPEVVQNLHPNNTNLNNNNITTTNGEKDAVAAVVNFKKLKEKGDLSTCLPERVYSQTSNNAQADAQAEERMRALYSSKEHYTGQAVREEMMELDFKEGFIEKILKEYSTKKIEEKLDLLMERKNIQNPAGWLMAALKNDYRGEEEERYDEEPAERESQPIRIDSRFRGNDIKGSGNDIEALAADSQLNTPERASREVALKAIRLIKNKLSLPVYPLSPQKKGP